MDLGCRPSADIRPQISNQASAFYQYTQLHLGVQVRIALYAEKEENAEIAAKASFACIAALEDVFSNYRPHSELSTLTTIAYNKPSQVSDELFLVLSESQAFARATDGMFDITLGPLSSLWKEARQRNTLPNDETLAAARQRTGWHLITLDTSQKTVTLNAPNMQLDAGGIAKGYILDQALLTLSQHGIRSALIEAGGDLVVSAPPPGRAGWTIEVPNAPPNSPLKKQAQSLSHAAIATSGDTAQFADIDGIRYAHIIDPRTGLGNTSRAMATVIAPHGITADKFATALTVLNPQTAASLLQQHPEIQAYVHRDSSRAGM